MERSVKIGPISKIGPIWPLRVVDGNDNGNGDGNVGEASVMDRIKA